jgi:hypothetical protein
MAKIPLNKGLVAEVSDEDFDRLSAHKWYLAGCAPRMYAQTDVPVGEGRRARVRMHRMILGAPDGMDVDHINGDPLDNRRENLRLASRSQNIANAKGHADAASRFKGVSWHRRNCAWEARICVRGVKRRIGTFKDEIEAARAYDRAAQAAFGEFARVNGV